jgi:hypothetical protein
MDAAHILERLARLKQEMQDLQCANARLDEPRWGNGCYESRLLRLQQIKMDLAEMLSQFKGVRAPLGNGPSGSDRFVKRRVSLIPNRENSACPA